MELRRVAITGLGALTPIGNDVNTYWNHLLSGVSGAGIITHFDPTNFRTKIACEVKNFDILQYVDRKESRKLDLFSQYAIAASDEAINDSGLDNYKELDKTRVGVIFSSGMGGCTTFYQEAIPLDPNDPKISPYFITKVIADISSGHIAIRHGYMGLNYSISSACASSSNALADAFTYIRIGKADAIVAGGSEAPINMPGITSFSVTRALSSRNDDPQKASRPFDRDRDGFVMGEGAGALILEEWEHAKRRGAKIYGEIIGVGMSADAYHITLPHPEGLGAKISMQYALEDAGIQSSEVEHINMHATSTPAGDISEINAAQDLFGEHLKEMILTANKSSTGHLMGASGAVEAIATVLSLQNGIIPPSMNVENLDERIDSSLNLTLNKPQRKDIRYAISNSFGFGGHNTSILFKKYED